MNILLRIDFGEACHNERKVTCKHPVTGQPSQDNCIFVVNEQTVATMTSEEKKERPISLINEASNYNVTSDYAVHPMSPVGRTSRASKKFIILERGQIQLKGILMHPWSDEVGFINRTVLA